MGFIQSIFGSNTGAGFQASGTNSQMLTGAQNSVNTTQSQQNALLQALAGQNGIGNQSSALQSLQGVSGQYQNIANGQGPNPALTQLAQTTGQNVAAQSALMAGQRGAASNVGLIARQAAQQGAATQQQAAGQAANLEANQQLAGLQGVGSTQANIANLATQQVGQQQTAAQQAAQTALTNQANVYGLQSNINTTNAGIAQGNQASQAGLIGGVLGSVGAAGSTIGGSSNTAAAQGGEVVKYADGGSTNQNGQIITPNAASNNTQQGAQSNFGKQLQMQQPVFIQSPQKSGQEAGTGIYNIGKATYKGGKALYNYLTTPSTPADYGSTDLVGTGSGGNAVPGTAAATTDASTVASADTAAASAATDADAGGALGDLLAAARGGKVSALLSPGEKYLSPSDVEKVKNGASPMKVGKTVPGKPKVGGAKNSYANDTYKTTLEEGGIVVPRSETKSTDPDRNSTMFVNRVLAKKKKR